MKNASPLRYPGGKWRIFPFFKSLIELNSLSGQSYAEPYAGGASLALSLLFQNVVSQIYLNDIEPAVFAFWDSIVNDNESFLEEFDRTEVNVDQWNNQKKIYNQRPDNKLKLGFATFFLNRTNYSGILNGGMIGGKAQDGKWKLDARFNRDRLREQIKSIGKFRKQIHVSGLDALDFISNDNLPSDCLTYLDPPYFHKGQRLYHNAYKPEDHAVVSKKIFNLESPWIVSYDDIDEIRLLYKSARSRRLNMVHTARTSRSGKELLFFSPKVKIPVADVL